MIFNLSSVVSVLAVFATVPNATGQFLPACFGGVRANNVVVEFRLQDASGADIGGLPSRIRTRNTGVELNIEATACDASDGNPVASVLFELNGSTTCDNVKDYTLFAQGDLVPFERGSYTLTATPYDGADCQGVAGMSLSQTFRVQ